MGAIRIKMRRSKRKKKSAIFLLTTIRLYMLNMIIKLDAHIRHYIVCSYL